MRRSIFLACVLSLAGCASVSLPAETLDGVYPTSCHVTGVQHERGEPDAPIDRSGTGTFTIENGAIVLADGCPALPIIGYDGFAFDVQPTTCGTPPRETRVIDGHGTAMDESIVSFSLTIVSGNVPDYWSETTMECDVVR